VIAGSAYAMPVGSSAIKPASEAVNPIEKTAVYIVEGNRYCFYFEGWHGPGWYRCGFAFRRGLGWGGVYGWHSWRYGPADRRFGSSVTIREDRRHHDGVRGEVRGSATIRERATMRERRGEREGVRGEIRGRTTVREGRDHREGIRGEARGSTTIRERATVRGREGTTARGESQFRSETTGRGGSSAGVSGRSEIRGSGTSGGSAKGGATVSPGGGASGGTAHKDSDQR
jgi:hypothetical protein